MTTSDAGSSRATVQQQPELAHCDRATIDAILAEGLVCHAAFVDEGTPVCIPTTYAPFENGLVLHGAVAGRMIKRLASGDPCSLCVTLLDGVVLARTAMF